MLLEPQYCSLRLRETLAARRSQQPKLADQDEQPQRSETLEESLELHETMGAKSSRIDRNKDMNAAVVQGLIEELEEKINLPFFVVF